MLESEKDSIFEHTRFCSCNFRSIWFYFFFKAINERKKEYAYKNPNIFLHRNIALIMYMAELALSLVRLGLFSIRRYIISIIINLLYLFLSIIGFYGAAKLNAYLAIFHFGLITIIYLIFLVLMIVTFKEMDENSKGEIFFYYIPLLIEIIPLIGVLYFTFATSKFQINFEKDQKIDEGKKSLNEKLKNKESTKNEQKICEDKNKIIVNYNEKNKEIPKKENDECCICFNRLKDSVFYPCGHICCCFECSNQIFASPEKLCPICRSPITNVLKVYKV